jgi:hypothetical protein
MSTYYPLKTGNSWTYKTNDGKTFTNTVVSEEDGTFIMTNSTVAHKTHVKKDGDTYFTDAYEAGNMQPFLKENATAGDAWDIKYKANTIDSILSVEVRSIGGTKEVEGNTYNDVMEMEGNMSFIVNGASYSANTKYTWYYSKGVGLILTTSTLGDNMPLVSSTL